MDTLITHGRDQGDVKAWIKLRRDHFSHENGDYEYLAQRLSADQMGFLERLPVRRLVYGRCVDESSSVGIAGVITKEPERSR